MKLHVQFSAGKLCKGWMCDLFSQFLLLSQFLLFSQFLLALSVQLFYSISVSFSYVIGTIRVEAWFLFLFYSISLNSIIYLVQQGGLHISNVQSLFILVRNGLGRAWKLCVYIVVAVFGFSYLFLLSHFLFIQLCLAVCI